jgi:hypothetical protein
MNINKAFRMKHLVTAIIVFSNAQDLVAQYSKIDTLVSVTWTGTAWQNYSRTINSYDAECRLKTALNQKWDAAHGIWADYSIGMYSYVSGNYISEILTRLWLNNSWTNNDRQTYSYDGSFKIILIVTQIWSLDHWSDYTSTSNEYDTYGYIDSVLVQVSYGGALENSSLTININNSDGVTQQTIKQNWNRTTLSWDNYSKYSVDYKNDRSIDTATTALWDPNAALWQPQTQFVYTYTATGKIFYYIARGWQTDHWVNQWLYTTNYDNYGFLSNVLVEQWDGFDFEKFTQTSYKNNSDGSIYQHLTLSWFDPTNSWVNQSQETYSYSASCQFPLNLLLFTATKDDKTVNLNWQTIAEKNISHFTIQRNVSGADFTDLGDIPALGDTSVNSYAYPDNVESITANKVFYRLKIFDKDGLYTYSNLIPVELSANPTGSNANELKVYPNPAKDQLNVLFNLQNAVEAELRIIDISGKIVFRTTINNNPGNNIVFINLSVVSSGMYYVLLIADNTIQKTQFVKQ